ncbi:MAG: hypothetical protein LLG04_17305 [Parachlamydia sp.]|nr:hypothetical protein [Parachlamydia sp.]
MTRSVGIKLSILAAVLFGLWKIGPWQPTEEDKKWQADNAAFAEYIGYVQDLQIQFAHQMQKEVNLLCSGDTGRMHGKIEKIGFNFTAYRRASIEEARALQLYVIDKLVEAVNAHEKLRPYLDVYPFTYTRVSVSISFRSPYGVYCDGSVVHSLNCSELAVEENRNKLFYFSEDPYTGNRNDLFDEHYKEAVQRAAESPIPILKIHQTTPLEEAIDEVLPPYAEEMHKKYSFECEAIGGKMDNLVEDVGVQFVLRKRTSQEEAKKYMLAAVKELLEAINSNEKLRPYLSEFPFPLDHLKMRIRFAKQNSNSYKDGSIESVRLEGKEIVYYKEPPMDRGWYAGPEVFAKEPYEKVIGKADSYK